MGKKGSYECNQYIMGIRLSRLQHTYIHARWILVPKIRSNMALEILFCKGTIKFFYVKIDKHL